MAYWLSVRTTMDRASDGTHSSARRMPVSSATLLVASPRYSDRSCVFPSGEMSTTPHPAGPGLPEHAPSVYAIQEPASGAADVPDARSVRPLGAASSAGP